MRTLLTNLVLVLMVAIAVTVAAAEPWPRFRGPLGLGQSDATNIPVKWTKADYQWRIELPGLGHASPVVWGDKVIVTSADPQDATRWVLCRRATDGSEIWTRKFASTPHHLHERNSFASSTPALDGQRVYMSWATPKQFLLVALDLADGKQLWRVDLGPFESQHGFGTSPIVYGDRVILANEQLGNSFLAAYDGRTGREIWKCPRSSGSKTAYSVPSIFQADGGPPQLIFHSTAHGVTSVDPATGRENWSLPLFAKRCVASPLVAGELVFGSCGEGGRGDALVAVRPEADASAARLAYQISEAAPYVITPVVYKQLLFVWQDRGIVSCHELSTGKLHWRERIGGSFSGSPVCIGQNIYCISDDGEVVVLAASDKYQLLARNDLGEPSRATPAVCDGRLYLRTESHLMALEGAQP